MAILTVPLMARLHAPSVVMGNCLKCRSGIGIVEESNSYNWVTKFGLACSCQHASILEGDAAWDWPNRIDEDVALRYRRNVFRLRMLAWQWQTGRTLAGYWRRP